MQSSDNFEIQFIVSSKFLFLPRPPTQVAISIGRNSRTFWIKDVFGKKLSHSLVLKSRSKVDETRNFFVRNHTTEVDQCLKRKMHNYSLFLHNCHFLGYVNISRARSRSFLCQYLILIELAQCYMLLTTKIACIENVPLIANTWMYAWEYVHH